MKKYFNSLFVLVFLLTLNYSARASKLVFVKVLDKDHLHLYFQDGEVSFVDDGLGDCAHDHCNEADNNELITYGSLFSTANASGASSWSIKSTDDASYGTGGQNPTNIYRKSKLTAMSQEAWGGSDYTYDWAYEHHIFLKLPTSLEQGKSYTIDINGNVNSDVSTYNFTFDIFNSPSEAVKVNLVGYTQDDAVKAADLYMWMGDGGGRDYTSFEGNAVYIYDVNAQTSQQVGTVSFWKSEAGETIHNHKMLKSDVWKADFTGFNTPGTYRVAIEGVGCSEDFEINTDVYFEPFKIGVQGFFYMRIGQDNLDMAPVPRRPLYIPNESPANTKVYLTSMHPYHSQWNSFTSGDQWDQEQDWVQFRLPGNPTNPNAYGGHSDALDWDRHLGHVSIIYDMLLPYVLTGGSHSDDNLGIAESGNGIPDLLDEARNEVDFWLSLRAESGGYSHGLTNPDASNALYQSAPTTVAAWANAANASMLAYSFQLDGNTTLMQAYRDSAIVAFNYASVQSDQQLDKTQNVGNFTMSGRDFKLTAAAFLYNLTGNTTYEDVLNSESRVTSATSLICDAGSGNSFSEMYAVAGYLMTPQTVNHSTLYNNMKASIIYRAKQKEANYTLTRPSRRGSDHNIGWFQTEIVVQRTLIAHAISADGSDKDLFRDAMMLEADYSLGRNPMNRILMTTATTALSDKRSIENAYTSGWDDGSPGVHPGHTPYMNAFDWGGLIMGRPKWMTDKNYPTAFSSQNPSGGNWPMGELYFNTRFVYSHCEFTPQQTMRGKMALYAYIYGIGPDCARPELGSDVSLCGAGSLTLEAGLPSSGRTFEWQKDGIKISGETGNTLVVNSAGKYQVTSDESGCRKSDMVAVLAELQAVDLGESQELCSQTEIVLDAHQEGTGLSYGWEKDSDLLSDSDSILVVTNAGMYKVTISAAGCADVTDEVLISSQLLPVVSDTICEPGTATLAVSEVGTYNWYSSKESTSVLFTGIDYSPSISANDTFYVEDASGVSTSIGKAAPGSETWGAWADSYAHKYKFEVYQALTLKSIDVHATGAGTLNIVIYNDAQQEVDRTTVTVNSGVNTVDVNYDFAAGTYYLNAAGSDAPMLMDNDNSTDINYPYEVSGVASISGTEPAWVATQPWYLHFYNWKISSGNTCARTPVYAVIDGEHSECEPPDSDNDGTPDDTDACPNDPNKAASTGQCGCGVADTDTDSDGIADCNDTFPNDFDNDGIKTSDDCDDDDNSVGLPTLWYADSDTDGLGVEESTVSGCTQPTGYAATFGDECPLDGDKTTPGLCGCGVTDVDEDNDQVCDITDDDLDNDNVVNSEDCDPNDANVGAAATWYQDFDNDGLGNSSVSQVACVQPNGYINDNSDLNDQDFDNDGVSTGDDCDDEDVSVNLPSTWYEDTDNDGAGDPTASLQACEQPVGYVAVAGDDCPDDINKTAPGDCGCGATESSCLDCANVPNGTAAEDVCGTCAGGTTGLTAETDVSKCVATGVDDQALGVIQVYPNPFEESVIIECEGEFTIAIFDIHSQKVFERKYAHRADLSLQLAAGVYVFEVTSKDIHKTQRVVKL